MGFRFTSLEGLGECPLLRVDLLPKARLTLDHVAARPAGMHGAQNQKNSRNNNDTSMLWHGSGAGGSGLPAACKFGGWKPRGLKAGTGVGSGPLEV